MKWMTLKEGIKMVVKEKYFQYFNKIFLTDTLAKASQNIYA